MINLSAFCKYIVSILVTLCIANAKAKTPEEAMLLLNKGIEEVQTATKVYKQAFELIGTDGDAIFKLSIIDNKGKVKDYGYAFNFRDFSKELLNYKISKEEIRVVFPTSLKNKFVKVEESGNFDKYDSEFLVYVRDYDKAKEIMDAFGILVVTYKEKGPQNPPPSNFNELVKWVESNIAGYETEKGRVEQNISFDTEALYRMTFTIKSPTQKGEIVEEYVMNVSDLLSEVIKVDVKNELFTLYLITRNKNKFITYIQNGEVKNNTNQISISSTDLPLIKSFVIAFQDVIKLGADRSIEDAPNIQEYERALTYFKSAIDTDVNGSCVYRISDKPDSKGEIKVQEFSFADLDENGITINSSGSEFEVKAKIMNKQKYVTIYNNETLIKFDDEIVIRSSDLESTRFLPDAIKTISKDCKSTQNLGLPEGSVQSKIEWLGTAIPNFKNEKETIIQKLEIMDSNPCNVSFKVTEESSGRTKNTSTEIKLYFLDPSLSKINVSGKSTEILMLAKGKEKVFATTNDDKPGSLVNGFTIKIDEIQKSKQVFEVLNSLIKECQK